MEQLNINTMMVRIRFFFTILFFAQNFNAICQPLNQVDVKLFSNHMITDGISRYSEPKISPDGTKVLTTKNSKELIYIDLSDNKETVLMKGSQFPYYCWIDLNTIYFYRESEINYEVRIELCRLKIDPYSIETEFISLGDSGGTGDTGRIPYLINGKHNIYYDFAKEKVYCNNQGNEIEITHQQGIYFRIIVSNNDNSVIIHKNNGKAYSYDLKGSGENIVVASGSVTSWSPNDDYLLYFKDFGGDGGDEYKSELYICTSDGKNHQQLTFSDDIREFYPDWAKNCNKITFIDDKDYQLYTSEIIIK